MNAEKVVAMTTLTVGRKDGSIKASAKLETVPSSETRKVEVRNCHNSGIPYVPLQPSAPQRSTGMLK
jgi:hypothetical protein